MRVYQINLPRYRGFYTAPNESVATRYFLRLAQRFGYTEKEVKEGLTSQSLGENLLARLKTLYGG